MTPKHLLTMTMKTFHWIIYMSLFCETKWQSMKVLSFRDHPNLYNFHFMNFLCPDKEWIQIKPLSCMHLQTGFFHLPHGDFFIEPVKKHPLADGEYHPHVVYKRQRRSIPEMKEPACGLKGIVLNLLTGCRSLFSSVFFFFYETCYYSNLFSLPHSVARKYVPLYISLLCTQVCILNRKGERNLLLPCHVGWCYLYGISNAEIFLSLFLIP